MTNDQDRMTNEIPMTTDQLGFGSWSFMGHSGLVIRHLLVLFWLLACAPALADFTFIHASDTHAGSPENAKIDAALFQEMRQMNPAPNFVIVTGDIVDYGRDD